MDEDGSVAWTDGMKCFGFDEMEIVNLKQEPSELQENLYLLIEYCINNNVGFHDGETLKINMIYM